MVKWISAAVILAALALALPAAGPRLEAQPGGPRISPIDEATAVEGVLNDEIPFEWWQFQAAAGDHIRVLMTASAGLAPTLGLLDPAGQLISRSVDGAPDSIVGMDFVIQVDGLYTIIAARAEAEPGAETSGRYTLVLQRLSPPSGADTGVTFTCRDNELAMLAALRFVHTPGETDLEYPIRIYGLDGLAPTIRVQTDFGDSDICFSEGSNLTGDRVILPGEAPVEIADGDSAAQLTITTGPTEELGMVTIAFGAPPTSPGRFLAVIEGFAIAPGGQIDEVAVRHGPLAARSGDLWVYMVATGANNRLDPVMWSSDGAYCDDAGRRGCEDAPALTGAGVVAADGTSLLGGRFDAGLRIPAGDREWHTLSLASFSGSTHGDYALILIGSLPARTSTNP